MNNIPEVVVPIPADERKGKKKRKKPDLPIVPVKNAADYQRMKLQRLFANPDKPVVLPVKPKDKNLPQPPEFVRNIMGSSAGAGSGEFHVYRHLRRKEYARQKFIQEKGKLEKQDDDFRQKIEDNKSKAERKTAKKRAKRLKKKLNAKKKAKMGSQAVKASESESSSSSESDSEHSNKTNASNTVEDKPMKEIDADQK